MQLTLVSSIGLGIEARIGYRLSSNGWTENRNQGTIR